MNTKIILQLNPVDHLYTLKELDKNALETESFIGNLKVVVRSDITDNIFDAKKLNFELEQLGSDSSIYELSITLPNEINGSILEINLFYKNNSEFKLASYNEPFLITENKNIELHLTLYALETQAIQNAPEWMNKDEIFNTNNTYLGEWTYEHLSEIPGNHSINIVPVENLIAGYDGDEIYLIYATKDQENSSIFFSIYEMMKKIHRVPKHLINPDNPINLRNGFLRKTNRFEIIFYLSHNTGIYCFRTNVAAIPTTVYHNQFTSKYFVPHSSTLANIGSNACVIGGALANHNNGLMAAGTSVSQEQKHPMICHQWLWNGRNNPVVEYFDDKLYFIGGNIFEHQPLIELKEKFIKHINVHIPIVNNSIPNPKNIHYLKNINSVTYRYCRLQHQIYLFPCDIFRDESSVYLIYDTLQNEVYKEKLEKSLYKKIIENEMTSYNSLQVVPIHDKSIYFILTYSTASSLKTLFIFANTIKKNL